MALNVVLLAGRLARDPIIRDLHGNGHLSKFTIACERKFKDPQTGERQSDFIRCTAWDDNAVFVENNLKRGSAVVVEGTLQNDDYTDRDGNEHHEMAVVVSSVRFQDPDYSCK